MAIYSGLSRYIGNIGYTRHSTKKNHTHKHNTAKKMKTGPARTPPILWRWTQNLANGKQSLSLTITNLRTNQVNLYDRDYVSLSWQDILEIGFLVVIWTSPPGKFYSRHPDLVSRCGIYVSQMTTCSHVSFFGNHNPILSWYTCFHLDSKKSNPIDGTCGGEIAYPSGAPDITPCA